MFQLFILNRKTCFGHFYYTQLPPPPKETFNLCSEIIIKPTKSYAYVQSARTGWLYAARWSVCIWWAFWCSEEEQLDLKCTLTQCVCTQFIWSLQTPETGKQSNGQKGKVKRSDSWPGVVLQVAAQNLHKNEWIYESSLSRPMHRIPGNHLL